MYESGGRADADPPSGAPHSPAPFDVLAVHEQVLAQFPDLPRRLGSDDHRRARHPPDVILITAGPVWTAKNPSARLRGQKSMKARQLEQRAPNRRRRSSRRLPCAIVAASSGLAARSPDGIHPATSASSPFTDATTSGLSRSQYRPDARARAAFAPAAKPRFSWRRSPRPWAALAARYRRCRLARHCPPQSARPTDFDGVSDRRRQLATTSADL